MPVEELRVRATDERPDLSGPCKQRPGCMECFRVRNDALHSGRDRAFVCDA